MKLKNISFFERHFEKFVILLALTVLGFALWHWGIRTPNTVPLAGKPTVRPGEVDQTVQEHADALAEILKITDVHIDLKNLRIDPISRMTYDDLVRPLIGEPGDPAKARSELVISGLGSIYWGPRGTIKTLEDPFYEPKVPAPKIMIARSELRTIDPAEFDVNNDLAQMFVNAPGTETAEVSVLMSFDMLEMVNQLMMKPSSDQQPIPLDWWRSTWEIVDVQLERQEQMPDGTWGKQALVPPLPGGIHARAVQDRIDPVMGVALGEAIKDVRAVLIRPPFFSTIGEPWVPPVVLDERQLAEEGRAGEIRAQVMETEKKIEETVKKIQQVRDRMGGGVLRRGIDGLPPSPESGVAPGSGIAPGSGGPAVRPGAPRPPRPEASTAATAAAKARAEKLIALHEQQLKKLQAEVADLDAEYQKIKGKAIERAPATRFDRQYSDGEFPDAFPGGIEGELGVNPYAGVAPASPGGPFVRPPRPTIPGVAPGVAPGGADPRAGNDPDGLGVAANLPPNERQAIVFGGPNLEMWAIDMTAQPGKTYRYRAKVRVINPLFNKAQLPGKIDEPESQRARHADLFLIASEPSEWSEPVQIEPMSYEFAIASSPNPKPGQVTFEVWRFALGGWRSMEFKTRAGDPIGSSVRVPVDGVPTQIDFSTGKFCLDIDFEFLIPGIGNVPRKMTQVLKVSDSGVEAMRVDLDKDNPERKKNQSRAAPGGRLASGS